jgi:hypothetical protein
MPRSLLRSVDGTDILDLEEFRGLVPDEDIRAAYSFCRNYAFSRDKARLIRERAGVIDGQGNVMPGYVLLDNGCIVGGLAMSANPSTPEARLWHPPWNAGLISWGLSYQRSRSILSR